MDRVFEKGAIASPPSPPATPSSGYPTAGDPATGQMPTQPGPYWFHQITEEMRNAIVAAGLTPDHTQLTQLRDAINALILQNAPGAPVGTVIAWTTTTPPADYLECNGAAISRTAYSALFGVIGTVFGAGDGSTTFNLPDLRAEFIRGWDNGRGVDSGRGFGSWQADDYRSHMHSGLYNSPYSNGYNYLFGWNGGSGSPPNTGVGSFPASSLPPGNHDGLYSTAIHTGNSGGAETRSRNVALMFCIKYQ